jgi:hypothetical protein
MTLLNHLFAPLIVAGALAGAASSSCAESHGVFSKGGIAIAGYDAVIYFRENRAAKGKMDHALMWRGATWLFVSDETMEAFEMNPTGFAPQYGGYCALAVAQGQRVPSDPEAFTVHAGKLYLNNSAAVRDIWLNEADENISAADENWAAISGQ